MRGPVLLAPGLGWAAEVMRPAPRPPLGRALAALALATLARAQNPTDAHRTPHTSIASFVYAPSPLELACPAAGGAEVPCYRVEIKISSTDGVAGFELGLAGTAVYPPPVCTLTAADADAQPAAVVGACSAGCSYVAPIAAIVAVAEVVQVAEACEATTGLASDHCVLTAADPGATPPVAGHCSKVAIGAPYCRYVAPVAPVAPIVGVPPTIEACINAAVDTKIDLANEVFPNYGVSINRKMGTCADPGAGTASADPAREKEACSAVLSASGSAGAFVPTGVVAKHIATVFVANPADLQVEWDCQHGCGAHASTCWVDQRACTTGV